MSTDPDRDYKIVARIQRRFMQAGWRWQETIFKDYSPLNTSVRFSPSQNCHAFDIGNSSDHDERRYGWGRMKRVDAWVDAEAFLLDEIGEPRDIERLREYKDKYGV